MAWLCERAPLRVVVHACALLRNWAGSDEDDAGPSSDDSSDSLLSCVRSTLDPRLLRQGARICVVLRDEKIGFSP